MARGLVVLTMLGLFCNGAGSARAPLTLSTPAVPPAVVGRNYNSGNGGDSPLGGAVVNIHGGSAPYSCRVISGKLPAGLSLSERKPVSTPDGLCVLVGTPAGEGEFTFTVQVSDAASHKASARVRFVVCTSSPPVISNIKATATSATSETITWTTNVPADSQVIYGEYAEYSSASAIQDTGGVMSHSVKIPVRPNVSYGFVVVSRGIVNGTPADYLIAFGPMYANTFRAGPSSSSGPLVVGMQGSGPHSVAQGFPMYVQVYNWTVAGAASFKFGTLKFQVGDIPPYTEVRWPDPQDSSCNYCGVVSSRKTKNDTLTSNNDPGNTAQFAVLQNIGGTTPSGTYILTVTMYVNGRAAASFPWIMKVTALASLPGKASRHPPIPGLSSWQSNMLTYGERWVGTATPGCEACVAYYDGSWVYQQIANYTGKSSPWVADSQAVRTVYRDYVLANPTRVPGRQVFPEGLYSGCKVNFDSASCSALHALASQSVGAQMLANNSAYADPLSIREACYMLGAKRLDYDAGGGTTLAQVKQMAAYCLGDLDQIVNYGGYEEPFFDGLAAKALIDFYHDTNTGNGDVRVLPAIQQLADHLWRTAWLPWAGTNGMFDYVRSLYGQFGPVLMNQTEVTLGTGLTNLNLLIAPMYAWLYKVTGQEKYLLEGDTIWYAGVSYPPTTGIGMSGKNFSQNYIWSFDYVKWRSAP